MLNMTGGSKIIPLVSDCLEQAKPFSTYEQVLKVTDAKNSQGRERGGPLRTNLSEEKVMVAMAVALLVIVVMAMRGG